MKNDWVKLVSKKLKEFDKRIRNSFGLIRNDIDDALEKVEAMRTFLRERERRFEEAWIDEEKLRRKFKEKVEEFSQKILQLKVALSSVRSIQNEVVVRKDLAIIEDEIKTSFKNEVDACREEVRYLRELVKENEKRIRALERKRAKNNKNKNGSWKLWKNKK